MDNKIHDRRGQVDLAELERLMAQLGAGQVAGADFKAEIKDVISVARGLGGLNVVETPKNQAPGVAQSVTGLNELDAPDSEAAKMRRLEEDVTFGGLLEKIVDLLLDENERTSLATSEKRLKSLLSKMQVDHEVVKNNLKKALAMAEEVTKLQNRMKALSWCVAIFGALMAALSVVTAGGTLGLLAAAVGVAGAVVGIVQQARQESIQKEGDAYADKKIKEYEKNGTRPEDRKSRSELAREYVEGKSKIYMGLSLGFGIASLLLGGLAIGMAIKAAKKVAAEAAKVAAEQLTKQGVDVASEAGKKAVQELAKQLEKELAQELAKQNKSLMQKMLDRLLKAQKPDALFIQKMGLGVTGLGIVGNTSTGVTNVVFNFENANRQKELADWQAKHMLSKKGLEQIEAMMEDEKETLKKIVELESENLSKLVETFDVEADTSNDIARRIGGAVQMV